MSEHENPVAIKVSGVSKTFKLPHEKQSSLKGMFLSSFSKKSYELQHALKDINFEVKKGEFFGIVGRNGCGKSTLLKCIAGVYAPNEGSIKINGSLVPFIELGVGFNPELTGRDNVYLNGALIGFNRQQMDAMYDEIVEFAELKDFMDQKLKNYSSGMQVRLAFSIAIRAKSDILLLDEVLAVGDAIFQQKCFNYFHELKRKGKTVLLVSHDTNALRQYCTNGVLIEQGEIVSEGPIETILNDYTDILTKTEAKTVGNGDEQKETKRHGSGRVLVESVTLKDESGKPKKIFGDGDKVITIEVEYKSHGHVEAPVYGIVINDVAGRKILASNNLWHSIKSTDLQPGLKRKVSWRIPNIFNSGEFYISPAVADTTGRETYDWVVDMKKLKVRKKLYSSAIVNIDHSIELYDEK